MKSNLRTPYISISPILSYSEPEILFWDMERVVKKHQTFTVNIGLASFPSMNIITSDSLKANGDSKNKGYNFSVDYRFYLSKENKYSAPRGVY
jgi:hypothetical protein